MKLFAVALLLGAGYFQMPSTPPIKMGLWETSSTVKTTMPGMDMPARTIKARSCFTAKTWTGAFGSDAQQGCTRSHETWSGRKYSFDLSCPAQQGTGHIEAEFPGTDAGHGSAHIELNGNGRHMVMDRTFEMHYVGADCGAVTPEKPVLVP